MRARARVALPRRRVSRDSVAAPTQRRATDMIDARQHLVRERADGTRRFFEWHAAEIDLPHDVVHVQLLADPLDVIRNTLRTAEHRTPGALHGRWRTGANDLGHVRVTRVCSAVDGRPALRCRFPYPKIACEMRLAAGPRRRVVRCDVERQAESDLA